MDKGQSSEPFIQLVKDLEPPGSLTDNISYDFAFSRVELPFETFAGISFRIRYYVGVVINRNYGKVIKEEDFLVHNALQADAILDNPPIHMNIGLSGHLQLDVVFAHSKYHLKDVITGHFKFRELRIKVKHIEVCINKKEASGEGGSVTENKIITRLEIMDGEPVVGEVVPIRLFLSSIEGLTPTQREINNTFSCTYFLSIMIHDEEGRKFFKQHEFEVWRKK
jgi:vacuolar protein sorting-associated protein 26